MTARFFSVAPGQPFLKVLAQAVLAGKITAAKSGKLDPLALQDVTLLLPTRRAARAAQDAFLAASGERALLLPRIRPISEGEEDLGLIAGLAGLSTLGSGSLELPPAVSSLERTLTLMQLVLQWRTAMERAKPEEFASGSNTPAQAASLAHELAKLMDILERENVALANLKDLVPDSYSEHWQKTVEFLKIITEFWPVFLQARGFVSPVARTNALILAEANRLQSFAPSAPVIVAGVTGSIPATVTLMRAVAALPNGAIVLPALDLTLDEDSWQAISPDHPEHPQFGLKKLLDALGIARSDVEPLPGSQPAPAMAKRNVLISETMRPSATTARWHRFTASADKADIRQGLQGLSLIAAPTAQDEAEVVALIMREAIEVPGRTVALVSPDRLLARRVAVRLEAWGIRVDDSAGRPFAKTVPGTFLNLVVNAAVKDFAPAALMSLLKHPLCRLGLNAFDVRRFGRALELAAFRAPYLGQGLDGVEAALAHGERARGSERRQHPAVRRLWQEDWDGARDLIGRLKLAYAPLSALYGDQQSRSLKDFANAHIQTAEALAVLPTLEGEPAELENPIWQGEAGEAANLFFVGLLDETMPAPDLRAHDYADLYRSLLARENVRERTAVHPRVSIWGPFEARLQQPDILILGSLNEGTWPESAEPGAWLNRPMRATLKLPSPEEDIGRSAHDFVSLLGAERVYLTRAEKLKGVPTVPSRWLMRLKALLDGFELNSELEPDRPWLAWARARDSIQQDRRTKVAPAPAPPLAMRPRRLSVTRIEDWITNPYTIYARHILKLEPLPQLGAAPDQSLRGGLVHEVLARFSTQYPVDLPDDVGGKLKAIAAQVLEDYTGHPRVAAFWLPRLERFLSWFAASEASRRQGIIRIVAETSGRLVIAAPAGPCTLSARADRIDDTVSGLMITDYKTGAIPNGKAVETNRSPQLALEAAIALGESGFPDLTGRPVCGLRYIRASGGEPAGEEKTVVTHGAADLAQRALAGLEQLIGDFDRVETPYRAIRRPGYRYDYDDYAQLARVAEWSAHVDEDI